MISTISSASSCTEEKSFMWEVQVLHPVELQMWQQQEKMTSPQGQLADSYLQGNFGSRLGQTLKEIWKTSYLEVTIDSKERTNQTT